MKVNVKRFKILIIYTIISSLVNLLLILLVLTLQKPIVSNETIISSKILLGEPNVAYNEVFKVCSTSSVKTYMDYRKITSKTSAQYKYIKANMKVNDKGLLVDKEGYIGVALGSYFGKTGSKYIITLDTGVILKVVKIEAKSDSHTFNGCEQRYDGSVIEFVLDTNKARQHYNLQGNMNINAEFKGNIERIEVIK